LRIFAAEGKLSFVVKSRSQWILKSNIIVEAKPEAEVKEPKAG